MKIIKASAMGDHTKDTDGKPKYLQIQIKADYLLELDKVVAEMDRMNEYVNGQKYPFERDTLEDLTISLAKTLGQLPEKKHAANTSLKFKMESPEGKELEEVTLPHSPAIKELHRSYGLLRMSYYALKKAQRPPPGIPSPGGGSPGF